MPPFAVSVFTAACFLLLAAFAVAAVSFLQCCLLGVVTCVRSGRAFAIGRRTPFGWHNKCSCQMLASDVYYSIGWMTLQRHVVNKIFVA